MFHVGKVGFPSLIPASFKEKVNQADAFFGGVLNQDSSGFTAFSNQFKEMILAINRVYSREEAYVWLCCSVNIQKSEWNGFIVKRNEIITSIKKLSENWGWSQFKVKKFLEDYQVMDLLCFAIQKNRFVKIEIIKDWEKPRTKPRTNQELNQEPNSAKTKNLAKNGNVQQESNNNNNDNTDQQETKNQIQQKPRTKFHKNQELNQDDLKNIKNKEIKNKEINTGSRITNTEQNKKNPSDNLKNYPSPSFENYLNLWNDFAPRYKLSKIIAMTPKRIKALKAREKEGFNADALKCVMIQIADSDFLKGNTDRGWKVTFDFIIKNSENYIKIIEGGYR